MLGRNTGSVALLLVVFAATFALTPVVADDEVQDGKVYRIIRTDGKEITGEVTEMGDAYKVRTAGGTIVQTVKKSQVREITLVEDEQPAEGPGGLRRQITDAEIEEILGSESVEDLYVWDYTEQIDLMEELDFDEESVNEMKLFAGRQAKVLKTPHFVFVYTSDPAGARRLAGRLESVYRWNATFMKLLDLPPIRPERKLEVYYFNTFDEYLNYQTLCGFRTSGALGFYMPTNNRCAFFDMNTYPSVAAALERSQDGDVPLQERRRLKNRYEAWSNYMNLEVVQHEATHAIQFNIGVFPKGGDMGNWMVEGLCVQFEVPPSQEGGSFGSPNYGRLEEWREMYGPRGERVPWQSVKNMILSDSTGYNDYVMGWAINYYLRKQHKDKYAKWMRLMGEREDDRSVRTGTSQRLSDFEEIFGRIDEEWVQEFFDYVASLEMKPSAVVEDPRRAGP